MSAALAALLICFVGMTTAHAGERAPHPIDLAADDAIELRQAVEHAERRLGRRGATMLSSGGASLATATFFMVIAPIMMGTDTNGSYSPDSGRNGLIRRGQSREHAAMWLFSTGGALLATTGGFFQAGATRRSQARRLAAALEADDADLQAAVVAASEIDIRRGTRKYRAGVALSIVGGAMGVVATTMALTEHFGPKYGSDAYVSTYAWMAIAGGGVLVFGGPAYAVIGARQRNAGRWLQERASAMPSLAVLPTRDGFHATAAWTF